MSFAVVARSGSPAVTKGMKALRLLARWRRKSSSIAFMGLFNLFAEQPGDFETVLVAAAGKTDHDDIFMASLFGQAQPLDDRVGGFERGQDAFEFAAQREAFQGVGVVHVRVMHPARVLPVAVF